MEDLKTSSDVDLIRKSLGEDDLEAFDVLIERHLSRVHSLVRNMVSNHADTEDLTQEVFLRAWRKLASFNNHSSFPTWLHRIAVNVVYDHRKRNGRDPVFGVENLPPNAGSRRNDPGHDIAMSELDEAIRGALDSLSPKLRTAVVCHLVEGLSVAEVALIENCSRTTVHWRIHTARKQLRKILSSYV